MSVEDEGISVDDKGLSFGDDGILIENKEVTAEDALTGGCFVQNERGGE